MNTNTPTYRDRKGVLRKVCYACNGTGGHHVYHPTRNPELEQLVSCEVCCGDGSLRCNTFDPLETLAAERRGVVTLRDRPAFLLASATRYYNQAKARAMAPVYLP